MSQQPVIDCRSFIRDQGVSEGTLPVASLERLHDQLVAHDGEVFYRLRGTRDDRGRSLLGLQVSGVLQLCCQRCLEPISYRLEIDTVLVVVPEGAELSQEELEDDSRDFLPVAGGVSVQGLVEDEILLALPVVPRHERCGLPGANEAGNEMSPFAVLVGLKDKLN
jgi:uncharacterized protein